MKNVKAPASVTAINAHANPAQFDAVQEGAKFADAIIATGAAIYQALESVARAIEINHKSREDQEGAVKSFVDGFAAEYLKVNIARRRAGLLAKTKAIKLSDGELQQIELDAKNSVKVQKSQYKKVLMLRLFGNGGVIDRNVKEYMEDAAAAAPAKGASKASKAKNDSVINSAELVKTIDGFNALINSVINAGINSGNPEVIAKAESIKSFLNGATKGKAKGKAAGLGAALLKASA